MTSTQQPANPNTVLADLRRAVAKFDAAKRWDTTATRNEYRAFAGVAMADAFEKLDHLLTGSGALPDDWRHEKTTTVTRPLCAEPGYRHRPDDNPEPGDRCKDCGYDITWTGPDPDDWGLTSD